MLYLACYCAGVFCTFFAPILKFANICKCDESGGSSAARLRATTMATAGESKSPLCSYEIAANKQQWYFGQLPAQLSATFGSFSDVSATIFGSEYSFCNIF